MRKNAMNVCRKYVFLFHDKDSAIQLSFEVISKLVFISPSRMSYFPSSIRGVQVSFGRQFCRICHVFMMPLLLLLFISKYTLLLFVYLQLFPRLFMSNIISQTDSCLWSQKCHLKYVANLNWSFPFHCWLSVFP